MTQNPYTPQAQELQELNECVPISQFLKDRFTQLTEEVEARLFTEMKEAVESASFKSRRAANEEMNQIMRRLGQCASTDEIAAWLIDSTSLFSGQAALFEITGVTLRGLRSRGFPTEQERFEELEVPFDHAPAFAHCAEERDTVVALGSPAEVSPEVVAALRHASDEKIYLCPVVIEKKTVAVLYATAGATPGRQFVDRAALEILTQAAASAAEIFFSKSTVRAVNGPAEKLVQIGGMRARTVAQATILQQAKEARARWYARSAVAGIQLKRKDLLGIGREKRNIYRALKPEIDTARRTYQQDFLAVSPVIVDHLDKELLKLAHDDASLLGPDYPGSLV